MGQPETSLWGSMSSSANGFGRIISDKPRARTGRAEKSSSNVVIIW